jgi:hypothetical protein
MSQKIKVTFVFESDGMSDEEYYNQTEQEFYITEEMIIDLIEENFIIPKGKDIDYQTLTINKI